MLTIAAGLILQAQEPLPWRDFELRAGGFIASMDSGVAVKGESGLGAVIDVEDVLDLEESVRSWRLGCSFALGARHRLHADVFDISRNAGTRLAQDVRFGEDQFPAGADVDSVLGLQFYNLTYGYSVFQDDRFDIAVTLGLHGLRTHFEIEAEDLGLDTSERFFLPVPMPGLRADFALTPDFWLRHRLELLWFNLNRYRTALVDSSLALELVLFDHVSLGLGYNSLHFRLEMEEEDYPQVEFAGEIEFTFSGVMLYLNLFF